MLNFNSATDLWRGPETVPPPPDTPKPLAATSPGAGSAQRLAEDGPDIPVCCWNLCSGVSGRKSPRPSRPLA